MQAVRGWATAGGGRATCSREWLAAPPLALLPQQEPTELLKPRAEPPESSASGRWEQLRFCSVGCALSCISMGPTAAALLSVAFLSNKGGTHEKDMGGGNLPEGLGG
jgi:hypothetical protein